MQTSLRSRVTLFFLLAAAPAVLVSAGGVALLDRLVAEEIKERGDEIFTATQHILALEERRVEEALARVARREELQALAELVENEDELDRAEAIAGPLATLSGLDLLAVAAARGPRGGTLLSSAHLSTAAGDPAPTFARQVATATSGFAHELVAGNPPTVAPALIAVRTLSDREGRPALILYGGTRLDAHFLDLVAWTRGATLILESPGLRPLGFPAREAESGPGGRAPAVRTIALRTLAGGLEAIDPEGAHGGGARITVRIDAGRLEGARKRFAVLAVGLVLAACAGALAIGAWLSRRITEPILELSNAATEVGAGNLDVRVPPGGQDEVGGLIAVFNEMIRELGESRERVARAERVSAWREAAQRVAHEIKNPLSPIQMAMETLRKAFRTKHPELDAIVEESTKAVLDEVRALKRIVSDFSEFARLPKPRLEPVPAEELLEHASRLYGTSPEHVRIVFDAAAIRALGLPPVLADRDQVTRALINLVKNAIEALAERGGSVSLDARAATRSGRAGVTLTVRDDGPGMSEEVRARVFTPYFTTKSEGTGLGLAIVERIVEEHEGTLELDTAEGAGTSARIWLPA